MSVLTIILILLGIVFLMWGWRSENPPSAETLTALKGLAYLKREVKRLDEGIATLESRMAEQSMRCMAATLDEGRISDPLKSKAVNVSPPYSSSDLGFNARSHHEPLPEPTSDNVQSQSIPPKYKKVVDLAATGMGITEIASQLSLSQDAVAMVLQTYGRGGKA